MNVATARRRTARADGLVVVAPSDATVRVAFDGHVVWSVKPGRDGARTLSGWQLSWPPTLLPFLRGSTRLTVTDFSTDEAYVDEEITFDDGDDRVAVRDRHGHPLMVNKAGTLSRALDDVSDDVRREILAHALAVLQQLRGPGGVDAFVSFGALLGAVRAGEMIGHDCDVDLAYLSRHTQPVDVILESYRLQRIMRAQGWQTVRMSAADFKVKLPLSDGRFELIDVFAAFHVGDRFFQLGNHGGALAREDVVPTSTVTLDGLDFPAPARPERMLAFLYGPGWRVPDPAFEYDEDRPTVRRLDGWFRGFRSRAPEWNRFFASPEGGDVPRRGSSFALWADDRIPEDALVADLGCGNGRDTRWFAARGHAVRSFDFSTDARVRTRKLMRRRGLAYDVRVLQLDELRTVLSEGLALRGAVLYGRGLLDAIDADARANLWRMARLTRGPVLLELRAGREPRRTGRGLLHETDPERVVAEALAAGGRLVEREDGPSTDLFDRPVVRVTRLHLDFSQGT